MSFEPVLWAMKHSPVCTPHERLVLVALAEAADRDGRNAYQSKDTIARTALCDAKTVQNILGELRNRGVIAYGNQQAAAWIEKRYRPTVYDLMIPYSWFNDIDEINSWCAKNGREPLTPELRPDLAPPPDRKRRSDRGKPNPRRSSKNRNDDARSSGGETHSSLPENGANQDMSTQDTRGETDSSLTGGNERANQGGMREPTRGVSDSPNPPLQTHPVNPPHGAEPDGSAPGGSSQPTLDGANGAPPADDAKQTGRSTSKTRSRQKRKDDSDPVVQRAKAVADAWWRDQQPRPLGGSRAWFSLLEVTEAALREGYTEGQVRWGLDQVGTVPTMSYLDRVLKRKAAEVRQRPKPYSDAATWGDAPPEEPLSDEQVAAIFTPHGSNGTGGAA